jgi:hypothetical protein
MAARFRQIFASIARVPEDVLGEVLWPLADNL